MRRSSENSGVTGVFSVRLTWTRLEFRVIITCSRVEGGLGEDVVSQSLSTETQRPAKLSELGDLNLAPHLPNPKGQSFRCPLAASLIGAQHRGGEITREGWVSGEKEVGEKVRWVNKWKGIDGMNGKGWLGR